MTATNEVDEAQAEPFSLAELPINWIILFANDFEYVSDKRLAALSGGGTVIGCHIHAYYDVNGGLEAVEFASPAEVTFNELDILSTPATQLLGEMSRAAPDLEREGMGFTSLSFSLVCGAKKRATAHRRA